VSPRLIETAPLDMYENRRPRQPMQGDVGLRKPARGFNATSFACSDFFSSANSSAVVDQTPVAFSTA